MHAFCRLLRPVVCPSPARVLSDVDAGHATRSGPERQDHGYGTRPGFYLIVGPNWRGRGAERNHEGLPLLDQFGLCRPRVFMDDAAEDRRAIQPVLR
jgi:hypothetical protein